jgi:5-oxoprolinase (ATP-hydrolysing)
VRKINGENGKDSYRRINMGGKNTASMQPGERIIVMTPGGGGWGKVGEKSQATKSKDVQAGWRKGTLAARLETQETSV